MWNTGCGGRESYDYDDDDDDVDDDDGYEDHDVKDHNDVYDDDDENCHRFCGTPGLQGKFIMH